MGIFFIKINYISASRKLIANLFFCLTLLIIIFNSSLAFGKDQSIHALRSAYLYYFSHFIQWPNETVFPDDKLNLCASTEDDSDIFQLSTINNKPLGQQRLNIILLDSNPNKQNETCHILYLSGSDSAIDNQKGLYLNDYTLTVTEGDSGYRGAIHLFMQNNKLKFEIDNDLLTKNKFKASSKILRLSQKELP
ncbi:protein of unknown function [Alteromonadaceae bacterium Bs31]|nr:protein of unknown function [Alteromonadaceae bacterium Bs31]